ncbi:MAG: leucine--tRNA ligase [Bacteroidia bacterium]|nr:leucine--tRNA ligase [Bacteroidia bacterium]
MGSYDFQKIEKKWQSYWKDNRTFVAEKLSEKPKYYALDMFPYPSGKGLHVGHPLGYIATDIITRFKRLKGFNVLHPMGFDSFGLPAEQYAIRTGIHPAETTEKNISRYLEQMEALGFHYDPDAVLSTSDEDYYRWTQWIFLKLFKHWYNKESEKAQPIEDLIAIFEKEGNANITAATSQKERFSAEDWKAMDEKAQADILMNYRLAYNAFANVNWCPALGTVLANEEIKDGKSERGGHPVERKQMRQWMLRITAYADRLLYNLDNLDWSDSMKNMQSHWIGRSEGANITYDVDGVEDTITVFTTRPDTLYGNTFMVLAPEHDLVAKITTPEQQKEVEEYVSWAGNRSEKDRIADTTKTGVFTGGHAIHPLTGEKLPIWIADYVVITYGTGAIMAVPSGDQRDWDFAKKYGLDIVKVVEGGDNEDEPYQPKDGIIINSDFLNGMVAKDAIGVMIDKLVEMGIGDKEVTYRQRDVIWSRQRYWGEPTPIYFKNGIAYPMDESELPLTLPEVDQYKPSESGEPPLSRAKNWKERPDGGLVDLNTMPGLAGSSWYFMRYPDAKNDKVFADRKIVDYWMPVDLYVGGTEHAVGHLMYSRFWTMFLHDMGEVSVEEPFTKLVNQGKIQGTSQLVLRKVEDGVQKFVSADMVADAERADYAEIHVEVNMVQAQTLDLEEFKKDPMLEGKYEFITNADGEFKTVPRAEKMSKSYYNTVDPVDICRDYGADTLRLYEMFLGPLEMAKPWNTDGISGVHNFLKRAFNLFINEQEEVILTDDKASDEELKYLHQCIKKVEEDIERLAFNTCVPAFMVFVKEMGRLKCHKREILEPFLRVLSPFAPHFCEELWEKIGHKESILFSTYPQWEEKYLVESTINYPVQINGKVRTKIDAAADADKAAVEEIALGNETVQQWLEGKSPKKVIVVPGRIVNIVV